MSAYGVVTIVEGEAGAKIQALWQRLTAEHGAEIIQGYSLPYLSYRVANYYDRAAVEKLFRRVAEDFELFSASRFGVAAGVLKEFAGAVLPVARSPRLAQLHEALFQQEPAWMRECVRDGSVPDGFLVDNLALIEEEVPSRQR